MLQSMGLQRIRHNLATEQKQQIYINSWDFPGDPVVENLPCNAGDTGSIPGRGTKIPHALEHLSLRLATTAPMPCHN